ncbi:hypothetical protein FSARC_5996 [Fusarium sarcochroum]|uniref:Uncharacterized protein n=1 Tax=Fusarium sarcochroum TaxID=1208366 RepID=A0A8H4TYM0_9HYPO|nr:hypothetical protein FSARC_5996 [Fusarium sarcochroum]
MAIFEILPSDIRETVRGDDAKPSRSIDLLATHVFFKWSWASAVPRQLHAEFDVVETMHGGNPFAAFEMVKEMLRSRQTHVTPDKHDYRMEQFLEDNYHQGVEDALWITLEKGDFLDATLATAFATTLQRELEARRAMLRPPTLIRGSDDDGDIDMDEEEEMEEGMGKEKKGHGLLESRLVVDLKEETDDTRDVWIFERLFRLHEGNTHRQNAALNFPAQEFFKSPPVSGHWERHKRHLDFNLHKEGTFTILLVPKQTFDMKVQEQENDTVSLPQFSPDELKILPASHESSYSRLSHVLYVNEDRYYNKHDDYEFLRDPMDGGLLLRCRAFSSTPFVAEMRDFWTNWNDAAITQHPDTKDLFLLETLPGIKARQTKEKNSVYSRPPLFDCRSKDRLELGVQGYDLEEALGEPFSLSCGDFLSDADNMLRHA